MAEAHPVALRQRAVEAYESGEGSYPEVAARFVVGEASLKRWVALLRSTGGLSPRPKAGGTPSEIGAGELEGLIAEFGDPTAGELTAAYNRRRPRRHRVHVSSMKRALHRHGYAAKKNADGRWRACGRTSLPSARPI